MSAATEIGPAETKVRKRGASRRTKPRLASRPASALKLRSNDRAEPRVPTAEASSVRQKRTSEPAQPIHKASASVDQIVAQLVELQKIRRFCIVSQSQCNRRVESAIASSLGFRTDQEEKDRKALFRRAAEIRKEVEAGESQGAPDTHATAALSGILPLIPLTAQARELFDKRRSDTEKEMERLAKSLPVWPWVESVRGLGALGLAIFAAEAGIPIGNYRTVSGLWKRFGLAVINGERQRKKTDKIEALLHGYSPKRRSAVWAQFDSMFKNASPHYRAIYDRRKEQTKITHPEWSDPKKHPKHYHNDALRVMSKAVIADLWGEWRKRAAA